MLLVPFKLLLSIKGLEVWNSHYNYPNIVRKSYVVDNNASKRVGFA